MIQIQKVVLNWSGLILCQLVHPLCWLKLNPLREPSCRLHRHGNRRRRANTGAPWTSEKLSQLSPQSPKPISRKQTYIIDYNCISCQSLVQSHQSWTLFPGFSEWGRGEVRLIHILSCLACSTSTKRPCSSARIYIREGNGQFSNYEFTPPKWLSHFLH